MFIKNRFAIFLFLLIHFEFCYAINRSPWERGDFKFSGRVECDSEICLSKNDVIRRALLFSVKNKISFEELFQAKITILEKIARLAPRADFSVGILIHPKGWLDLVGGLAGALVPSNWFTLHESKILYDAQKYSTISVLKNCIVTVETLYYYLHKVIIDYMIYKYYSERIDRVISYVDENISFIKLRNEKNYGVFKAFQGELKLKKGKSYKVIKEVFPDLARALMFYDEDWNIEDVGIKGMTFPNLNDIDSIEVNSSYFKKIVSDVVHKNAVDIKVLRKLKLAKINKYASGFTGMIGAGSDSNKSIGIKLGADYFTNVVLNRSYIDISKLNIEDLKGDLVKSLHKIVSDYNYSIANYRIADEYVKKNVDTFNLVIDDLNDDTPFLAASPLRLITNYQLKTELELNATMHAYLISKAKIKDLRNRKKHYSYFYKYFPDHQSLSSFKRLIKKHERGVKRNR